MLPIKLKSSFTHPTSLLVLVVFFLSFTGPAEAKIVKETQPSKGGDHDLVFESIALAWQAADEDALAKLVHQDGLRVTSGDYDRFTSYSPNQAFYYFRNQFQQHPTISFTFSRLQEQHGGSDRVHGMVVWKYRRPSLTTVEELRLVLVLTKQGEQWRLSEINTITTR